VFARGVGGYSRDRANGTRMGNNGAINSLRGLGGALAVAVAGSSPYAVLTLEKVPRRTLVNLASPVRL